MGNSAKLDAPTLYRRTTKGLVTRNYGIFQASAPINSFSAQTAVPESLPCATIRASAHAIVFISPKFWTEPLVPSGAISREHRPKKRRVTGNHEHVAGA
jgi:hypothetical protein